MAYRVSYIYRGVYRVFTLIMITDKQIRLMRLIDKRGEITSRHGRGIYRTFKGFYNAVNILERRGYVNSVKVFGTWFYCLTYKGEKFIRRGK